MQQPPAGALPSMRFAQSLAMRVPGIRQLGRCVTCLEVSSPERVAAVQNQIVSNHVAGRVAGQKHHSCLQVSQLCQPRGGDLSKPRLHQRLQVLGFLRSSTWLGYGTESGACVPVAAGPRSRLDCLLHSPDVFS